MRHTFGGSPADFAVERIGNQLIVRPSAVGTVWDSLTGGSQITDLTSIAGAPITEVTADGDGAVTFMGPDGVTIVYVDFGFARRFALTAVDIGEVLTDFISQGGEPGGWLQLDGTGAIDPSQLPHTVDWIIATAAPYSAVGNGATDATAALQAAVDAAAAARTTLYIPAGTYLVSEPILLPAGEGYALTGSGWGTSVKLADGADCFVFAMQGEDTRVIIRDMMIDGNCYGQSTAGTSGGIDASGAVACRFDNLHFIACRDDGLYLAGQSGGAFGHNNRVIGCLFDQSMTSTGPGRGIQLNSSDENQILGCDFEFLGGSGGTGFETAVCILDRAGTQFITACNFVGGATNNTKGVRIQDASSTKITACNFDGTAGDSIFIAGEGNSIVGNTIFSPGEVGTVGQASGIHLEYAAARNLIQGNTIVSSPTNGRTRSLIREEAAGPAEKNKITGNVLTTKGTLAVSVAEIAAPGTIFQDNLGTANNVKADSLTVDAPNRAAFLKTTSPTEHALTVYQASTTGVDVAAALNLISDNRETSAVYISGHETLPRGTLKVTHTNGGTGATDDTSSSALSIDLRRGTAAGTASQGIFVTSTDGGTTGRLLTLRNGGSNLVTVPAAGTLHSSVGALGAIQPVNHGLAAWSFDPALALNSSLLVNGTLYLSKLFISEAVTVTKLYWWVTTAGATPTAGQCQVGLYSSAGTRLAVTTVDADITSTGLKTTTITGQNLVAGAFYWVGLVFNATTAPTLARATGSTGLATAVNLGLTSSTYRYATNGTAQTALPASITPGSNVAAGFAGPWVAAAA